MSELIYLDSSATTIPCKEAIAAFLKCAENCFGNPSSLYFLGLEAEDVITGARGIIANELDCREDEIYFTSGGSESNNTAIFGAARLLSRRGKHIVTTAVEHPSVLEPMRALEKQGFEVTYLTPDKNGSISVESIKNSVRKDTILVSVMLVNNEVGALFPVEEIKNIIKDAGSPALLHTDCVQAFGKIDVKVCDLAADLVSISAHKIHGLKGAGALFVKKGIALPPLILGGGQEKGIRSGTEAVPNIAAFGAAVEALGNKKDAFKKVQELNTQCREMLKDFDNIEINSPNSALPFILNFSFMGYRSEILLHHLESFGICVSSGSACSKGKKSAVLGSMGLSAGRIDSALRISFSRYTTKDDITALCEGLKSALALKKSVGRR